MPTTRCLLKAITVSIGKQSNPNLYWIWLIQLVPLLVHCTQNNLNLRIKPEPIRVGPDATVYVWFLIHKYLNISLTYCTVYAAASTPPVTGSVLMRWFKLCLGQCVGSSRTVCGQQQDSVWAAAGLQTFKTIIDFWQLLYMYNTNSQRFGQQCHTVECRCLKCQGILYLRYNCLSFMQRCGSGSKVFCRIQIRMNNGSGSEADH